ncbi:MAG TPA: VWA domain-containing protein, partial [Thermoanaerobaculia bacterium]|nr:VWA domain-containing protein [Thermoanaerobaculia bacterium]
MVTRLPKTLPAFLLLMAIMLPVQAQQPPTAAQEELPVVFETVDVQVINIDVVVTDRKGNPITGLTLDDFEIYEDGTLQKLTNFYEVRGRKALQTGAPETEPRTEPEAAPAHLSRKIVFFIDNVSLAPFNRNRVFRAMKKFAASAMGPDDEAMIATWNRSMTIRVPFTSNVDQILRSLDEIAGESAYGISRESDRRTVRQQIKDAQGYGEAVVLARQYAQSVEHDLRTTVSGLKGLMQTTAGIEGKKVFVVTTEGLEMQPGADMFYYVEDVSRQQWGNSAGAGMLEGMAFQNAYLLQSIAHEANANGITLYTIHAGGLVGMSSTSADQQE